MYGKDGAPELEGVETDYGVRMISCRNAGDGMTYLRVSNFVLPCYGFVPTGGLKGNPEGYTIHAHVPVDDDLEEVRPRQLAGGAAKKRRQRRREETPVGKDVSQEARQEPPVDPPGFDAVVREEVVRPVPHDDSSSSRASIWREYRSK